MAWTTEQKAKIVHMDGWTEEVEPGANFREAVVRAAKQDGLKTFRVILNGEAVEPGDAPETLKAGDEVQIKTYDVAG